jgi:hypothetical protein
MRMWSLHPRYLDPRGLVALWREALLAQAVLRGTTRGYRHHPQLLRFREQQRPLGCIAGYLRIVHAEARARGYRFAGARIGRACPPGLLPVTRGQLEFEWQHLLGKVRRRDPRWAARLAAVTAPRPHPLFRVVPGTVAPWEKQAAPSASGARRAEPRWSDARRRVTRRETPPPAARGRWPAADHTTTPQARPPSTISRR